MTSWKDRLMKCGIPEETADKIVNYLFKNSRTIELIAIVRLMEEVAGK